MFLHDLGDLLVDEGACYGRHALLLETVCNALAESLGLADLCMRYSAAGSGRGDRGAGSSGWIVFLARWAVGALALSVNAARNLVLRAAAVASSLAGGSESGTNAGEWNDCRRLDCGRDVSDGCLGQTARQSHDGLADACAEADASLSSGRDLSQGGVQGEFLANVDRHKSSCADAVRSDLDWAGRVASQVTYTKFSRKVKCGGGTNVESRSHAEETGTGHEKASDGDHI